MENDTTRHNTARPNTGLMAAMRERLRHDAEAGGLRRAADTAATLLSWAMVPMMMPVYGIILIFTLSILALAPPGSRVICTFVIAGINILVPLLLIYLLKLFGIVHDMALNEQRERLLPYVITIACMAASGWYVHLNGAPAWVSMFFVGGAAAGFVNMLVNLRWKISAHSAGAAGVVAMLIRMNAAGAPVHPLLWWIVGSILMSGLLGTSRVWLGRHTVMQVLAGYTTGFCGVYFMTLV